MVLFNRQHDAGETKNKSSDKMKAKVSELSKQELSKLKAESKRTGYSVKQLLQIRAGKF